ncbi:hypothetical protein D3C80_1425730 [compost metagenome]
MIPSAIIDTLVNPPPENIDSRDSSTLSPPLRDAFANTASAFTPGNMINDPIRYTRIKKSVNKIRFLNSSTFQMFFMFCINRFIKKMSAKLIRFLKYYHLELQFLLLQKKKTCEH